MQKNLDELLNTSLYVHKELKADEKEDITYRMANKKVFKSLCLYDGKTMDNISSHDTVCTLEPCKDGNMSLKMTMSTDIENVTPRPWPTVTVTLKDHDLSAYNRILLNIYIEANGYHNFYYQISFGNEDDRVCHSPSLVPNMLNKVYFEVPEVKRDNVLNIKIGPWLMGTPPEGLPSYEVYLESIYAETVEADYVKGWDAENRIAFSHAGYFKNAKKVAITGIKADKFFLLENNEVVYENEVVLNKTLVDKNYLLDFSTFTKPGLYQIKINDYISKPFIIGDNAYDSSIWKSMNFLRLLRCGTDIPGVHSACHLNCRTVDKETGSSVPNFGGWHDAGDVSQFEIPTAEMAHALVDLALEEKDTNRMLYERIKEEARVGLNWLLQTRFGDGKRACAITYSIWRKNVLTSDNKTVYNNFAENGPFENAISSAALAKAYLLYKEEDEVFASWCLRAGIEDFNFAKDGYEKGIYTVRWGKNIDSQVCGALTLACCEIYRATGDENYINYAKEYAKIILACQERGKLKLDKPLRGFFYEDPAHTWILTYEHRGHEQSPVQGLAELCLVKKDDPSYHLWKEGLDLYSEYIKESIKYASSYGLVPGHVYILDKINKTRFTIPPSYGTVDEGLEMLKKQATTGFKLGENTYLRTFPIAIQRRGYHATLLSKTKAISEIYKVTKDEELKQICLNQLEWILGKNPFASSTMYGEGYNYHPLYVAFSNQMVGALPVGIMTYQDEDAPYWPTRTHAVYKEIWGHTTGKYLWVLADILK